MICPSITWPSSACTPQTLSSSSRKGLKTSSAITSTYFLSSNKWQINTVANARSKALEKKGKEYNFPCHLGLLKSFLSPSPKSCSRSWTVDKQRQVKGYTCSTQASFLHPTNSSPKLQCWLGIWWYWEAWWGWRRMQDLGGMSSWHATREIAGV